MHLLFFCVYADEIWKYIETVLNRSISATVVILSTDLGDELILIISVIAYLVYKNWLAKSYKNEAIVLDNCINNLQHFVKYKRSLYANFKESHIKSVMLDKFT